MKRYATAAAVALAAMVLVTFGDDGVALGATSLAIPAAIAFSVLGHSCGGIQEQSVATGFDATSGFPTGDVYLQTRCGGSGRGGGYHVTTYSAWVGATWDYTGSVVEWQRLGGAPTSVDPSFSAFDAFGNEVYNQVNAINVSPESCSVGNTTYCSYRAYLALAADFVPAPRVTRVSVASGPATGGTSVVVTGTGFTGAAGVTFGDTPAASFTVASDTSITAVSPPASGGTVDVIVTTAGGPSATSPSDQFTFVAAPTVTGLSPSTGPLNGGTLVTITGTGFTDVVTVAFGETLAGFSVDDDTTITAASPPGEDLDSVDVTITTIGGSSAVSAADRFTYTAAVATAVCGDGVVDAGEDCDDGAANGQIGDCCTATCQLQPEGTACADDGDLCTLDACDAAGACAHEAAPSAACTLPDVAGGASLLMRTAASGANQTVFRWGKGPAVALADFGDPNAGDSLRLCVYDQIAPGAYTLAFGGSPAADARRWTSSASGWKFRSTTGAPDGIGHVTLKAATAPLKAQVQVAAVRSPLFGPLPLQSQPSVVAQFKTSLGTCWGATFSTPSVTSATEFKAKSN